MHVQVQTVLLQVAEKGDPGAPPVVFLHGFPFSHKMWAAQTEAVSKTFRAIAYDLRGLGESSMGDGQYTIEGHVDDLIALLDHLEIQQTVAMGMSMGGYILLRALERHPERFRAAVLCNTRSEADSDEGKIARARTMAAVKSHGSMWFADDFVKKVFAPESFTKVPQAVEMIRTTIAHTSPLAISGMLLALAARTDTTASLSAISVPTLILVGEHDTTTPPEASRKMHERIKGSQLHVIPGAAHMSPLENPQELNARLEEFLAGLR